ncbi:MAG: hypothetical protein ABL932_19905, partial [Terricaulis sp.]
ANAFQSQAGGILGMFNTFSGGAVERMAIFALNVMPYISSSIIMQLLSTSIPSLERLKKEGEVGRKQINQYTRYLTLLLAVIQSYGISVGLQSSTGVVTDPGWFFVASTVITLTGGTMFLMWLGEQITQRGVGNGVSLIIFAGIVADLPRIIMQSLATSATVSLATWCSTPLASSSSASSTPRSCSTRKRPLTIFASTAAFCLAFARARRRLNTSTTC